ncbi:MAG: T9SS type A sorting domain-containing protein [Bacteroidota bacterium]
MKKTTLLFFFLGTISWVNAQVLNQNAAWPNPAWTVTGSYETAPAAFEFDPTTTANFAFDDDDALNGHEDNIAAESPVINLTPAVTAGETWLSVTVEYGYRYFANDQLRFEYWDADTSTWVAWGANIPGNNTVAEDNYCTTITKTTFTTPTLNVAGFTSTQLSGFKYRISYNDDPAAADWNYGFCFDSPTIVSAAPPACPTPSALNAVATTTSATLSWTENGTATLYNVEYGPNGFTQGAGTLLTGVSNSYNLTPLNPNTAYSYYVQSSCGGTVTSDWAGPFNFTTLALPPSNDECAVSVTLTVNPDFACGTTTTGTTLGATQSTAAAPCFGNPDDDVWYNFVATSASHRVVLSNIAAIGGTGTSTDAYMQIFSGACGSLVSLLCSDPNTANLTSLTVGQTYYVRVYTYGNTNNITFSICVGTPPAPPANDECTGAIALTVNLDYLCSSVTSGTVTSATPSNTDTTACFGAEDDDVWYSFVATSTTHRITLSNVAGSATDLFHSLWTGDCSSLTLVTGSCSDANTSDPTGLTIGQTYYVRVNTYTATGGQDTTFNICIGTPPPPPVNDDCAGAITVTCGSATTGTTTSATNENMAVCGISGVTTQNTPGVWFKYVGDGSDVTVTTCSPTITAGDSRIAVYSGACGTLTCLGGNDDAQAAGCATNTLASIVTFSTVSGSEYYILVYSYSAASPGTNPINFELNVSCVAACSPATTNDDCASAMPLTIGTTATGTDNLCSSPSLGTTYPSCGNQFGTYYDTWYSFNTGSDANFTINLANSTGTTGYALYSGDCATLAMVAGSCTTTGGSTLVTGLATGSVYYLRVFSTTPSARGSFELTVTATLGTGEFDSSSFSYYPNPVKNTLNLSYNKEISDVEVFNLLGQKVLSSNVNSNDVQVNMSNLANGPYMVKVTSNNQVKTLKVIKE